MTDRQIVALAAVLIVLVVAGLTIQRYGECRLNGGRYCSTSGPGPVGPSVGPGIR
jgi:hypothetical protein